MKEGDKYGGSEDPYIYAKLKEPTYCDKLAHMLRSIYWASQHVRHWNKVKQKERAVSLKR